IMQKGCACSFLFGVDTIPELKKQIEDSLNRSPFWCLLDIVPITNEKHEVVLFLASHKDITRTKMAEMENQVKYDYDTDEPMEPTSPSEEDGCLPPNNYQRRRSRAVLYQLSGHYRRSVTVKSKLKLNN
ncbi:unnamed protein product, partial [Medioppia subpectinata]